MVTGRHLQASQTGVVPRKIQIVPLKISPHFLRSFLCFCLVVWFFPPLISGSDQVQNSTEITYRFDSAGYSRVTHVVKLTNRVSALFTTSYSLALHGLNLQDISAVDHTGPLPVTYSAQSDHSQVVTLQF